MKKGLSVIKYILLSLVLFFGGVMIEVSPTDFVKAVTQDVKDLTPDQKDDPDKAKDVQDQAQADDKDKEKELEKSLGLPVTLRYHKNHSGTIQIHFSTEEDFNRIINKLI